MTPIGIPLAFSIGGASLIPVIIGSIFAGAIFGDHCSPISDTTVMASIFAGSDHIAHVKTQMPYAVLVAGISAVLYLLSSFIRIGWLLLIIGIVALVVLSRILGSRYQKKHFSAEEIALLDAKHIAVE